MSGPGPGAGSRTHSAHSAHSGRSARGYREKLIDEVKHRPVLYDTKHENHRDIEVRDKCWLEISERLGANSEVLKREWKILRDSLRQSLKATTKTGAPAKQWRYQSRMAFILPYMTKRSARQPMQNDIKMDVSTESAPEVMEPEVWEHAACAGAGECAGGCAGGCAGEACDHEALELFFASVCQSAKRLPRRLQAQLKRQVLDALLGLEEQRDAQLQLQHQHHDRDTKATLFNNF